MLSPRSYSPLLIAANLCLPLLCLAAINPIAARADDKKPSIDTTTFSQASSPRLRYRIVVDQGKWNEIRSEQWFLPPEVGAGIQAQLVDKLEKSGYFIVMEREATAENQASEEDAIDACKRASLPPDAALPPARQQRAVGN